MPESRTCSECGTPVNNDASEGFCPACMLEGALQLGRSQIPHSTNPNSSTRLGDYELLDEIARGGMGIVYRARQISLDRIVAVKLILIGRFAENAAVRRFKAEAAAAARLRHPNIVAIHEIGEAAGQHFFSMDHVEGANLADFMRRQPVSTRQAAQLLKTIAEALYYAHEQGIVHRDLKPSNILIDGLLEPRITDFGLAKDLKVDSDLTLTGQMLGSPNYISPEQASGKTAVGVPSDIYSLGAILYHLLSGRPPFAAETITETLQQVATTEAISPRLLNPGIPRDLETICLHCLEKEPARRYRNASELADELGRFLGSEPIRARPVSHPERILRWCRREPALASVLGLVLVVAIGSPIAAFRINRERQHAEEARQHAQANEKKATTEAARSAQVAQFMKQMLEGVGPSVALGRDTTMLREILDQTAERFSVLIEQPAVEADLRATLGNVYADLGEYTNAAIMHHEALALRRELLGNEHADVAQSLNDLAEVLYRQGQYHDSEGLHREALALRKRLFGPEHAAVASSLHNLAESLRRQGLQGNQSTYIGAEARAKYVEAEPLFRDALAMRKRLFGNEHLDVARSLDNLGLLLGNTERVSQSEAMHREELAIRRKLLGDQHPDVATSLDRLGIAMFKQTKYAEAEKIHNEALALRRKLFPNGHPDLASSIANLADSIEYQGRFAEAEVLLREALAMRRKLLGDQHMEVWQGSLNRLARVLFRQGNLTEAVVLHREILAIQKKFLGDEHPLITSSLKLIAAVLHEQGKSAEAESFHREALAMSGRLSGAAAERGDIVALNEMAWLLATCDNSAFRDGHRAVACAEKAVAASSRTNGHHLETLAAAHAETGQFAKAVALQTEALALLNDAQRTNECAYRLKLYQSGSPCREYDHLAIKLRVRALLEQSKLAEVEDLHRGRLENVRVRLPVDQPHLAGTLLAEALADLAVTLLVREKFVEAESFARQCLSIREKRNPNVWRTFKARGLVGASLLGQGKYAEAEPLLLSVCKKMEQREDTIPALERRHLKEALERLVQLYLATGEAEKAGEWRKELGRLTAENDPGVDAP